MRSESYKVKASKCAIGNQHLNWAAICEVDGYWTANWIAMGDCGCIALPIQKFINLQHVFLVFWETWRSCRRPVPAIIPQAHTVSLINIEIHISTFRGNHLHKSSIGITKQYRFLWLWCLLPNEIINQNPKSPTILQFNFLVISCIEEMPFVVIMPIIAVESISNTIEFLVFALMHDHLSCV